MVTLKLLPNNPDGAEKTNTAGGTSDAAPFTAVGVGGM